MKQAPSWIRRIEPYRVPLVLFTAALVLRLVWNLWVHPPGRYIASDMAGYEQRARALLDDPWSRQPWMAFYPYGTHFLFAGVKLLFGRDNQTATAVFLALVGSLLPVFTCLCARRVSDRKWIPPVAGGVMVFYYPLVSLGGYLLSEVPFCAALLASTYFLLRLIDEGQPRDAYCTGLCAALGCTLRAQLLLSVALFAVFWLLCRRHLPQLRLPLLLRAAIPLAIVLAFSAGHFYYQTGRVGLISDNGSLNMMFGRCHANSIAGGGARFVLPEFDALATAERRGYPMLVRLAPALGPKIQYRGYIGDREIHRTYIGRCVEATGWSGQLYYSATHLILLWGYNVPWPDRSYLQWNGWALVWQAIATVGLCVPSLIGLGAMFVPRRAPKLAVLALHYAGLLLASAIYFGGTRHRNPYDPILLIIALVVYAEIWRCGGRQRRGRGVEARVLDVGTAVPLGSGVPREP